MEYKSNTAQVIKNINLKLLPLKDIAPLQKEVATSIRAEIARRVFNDGISVGGSRIGEYNSTDELYINPKKSPKSFAPLGKPLDQSKATRKTGKKERTGKKRAEFSYYQKKGESGQYHKHKTRWFPSYRNFRQMIGRDVSVVNLTLSGRLSRSWVVDISGSDWVVGFNSTYGRLVASGQEEHFGKKIFGMGKRDFDIAAKIIGKYIKKARGNA